MQDSDWEGEEGVNGFSASEDIEPGASVSWDFQSMNKAENQNGCNSAYIFLVLAFFVKIRFIV